MKKLSTKNFEPTTDGVIPATGEGGKKGTATLESGEIVDIVFDDGTPNIDTYTTPAIPKEPKKKIGSIALTSAKTTGETTPQPDPIAPHTREEAMAWSAQKAGGIGMHPSYADV